MWMIRAYRGDDELAVEQRLGGLTRRDLERRLGFVPTKLGSTELAASQLASVADIISTPIDARLHYFLDFDADPSPATSKASELRVSA